MKKKLKWAFEYYVIHAVEVRKGHVDYHVKGYSDLSSCKMYAKVVTEHLQSDHKFKVWHTIVKTVSESEDADLSR